MAALLGASIGCNDASPAGASPGAGTDSAADGGATWRQETTTPSNFNYLWGCYAAAAGDLYAVGPRGMIFHSTGNGSWTTETSATDQDLLALWGMGGTVIAVGGAIVTRVGQTWQVTSPQWGAPTARCGDRASTTFGQWQATAPARSCAPTTAACTGGSSRCRLASGAVG
jgi:hypothetical protein